MIIPAGFGQLTFIFEGDGVPTGAVCTIGFEDVNNLGPTVAGAQAATNWIDTILVEQTNNVTLATVAVKLGPNETGFVWEETVGQAGGETADSVAPNTAYLIRKGTTLGGRRGRGRMFVPGVPENKVEGNGLLTVAHLASLQAACDDFVDKMVADDYPLVLLHETNPGGEVPPTPIAGLLAQRLTATQRRRLRR